MSHPSTVFVTDVRRSANLYRVSYDPYHHLAYSDVGTDGIVAIRLPRVLHFIDDFQNRTFNELVWMLEQGNVPELLALGVPPDVLEWACEGHNRFRPLLSSYLHKWLMWSDYRAELIRDERRFVAMFPGMDWGPWEQCSLKHIIFCGVYDDYPGLLIAGVPMRGARISYFPTHDLHSGIFGNIVGRAFCPIEISAIQYANYCKQHLFEPKPSKIRRFDMGDDVGDPFNSYFMDEFDGPLVDGMPIEFTQSSVVIDDDFDQEQEDEYIDARNRHYAELEDDVAAIMAAPFIAEPSPPNDDDFPVVEPVVNEIWPFHLTFQAHGPPPDGDYDFADVAEGILSPMDVVTGAFVNDHLASGGYYNHN